MVAVKEVETAACREWEGGLCYVLWQKYSLFLLWNHGLVLTHSKSVMACLIWFWREKILQLSSASTFIVSVHWGDKLLWYVVLWHKIFSMNCWILVAVFQEGTNVLGICCFSLPSQETTLRPSLHFRRRKHLSRQAYFYFVTVLRSCIHIDTDVCL